MEFLAGFLGAASFLLLFGAGALTGWALRGRMRVCGSGHGAAPEPPASEAQRRLWEERERAVREIENYSAETAYGMNP